MRLPTANTLQKIGISEEAAKAVRKAMDTAVKEWDGYGTSTVIEQVLDAANDALEPFGKAHGVEYVRHRDDTMHEVWGIDYINQRDPYYTTLMFDHMTNSFKVGAWGDIVETAPEGSYS